MVRALQISLYTLMALLAWIVAITSLRFLNFEIQDILSSKSNELLSSGWYLPAFYTHVSFGLLALVIGPFQFVKNFRNRYLRIHRWLGTVYIMCVLLAGLAGFLIAFRANGGIIASLGFMGLATAWLFTTYKAYIRIREKNIVAHEKWMLRNYALTFGAVTLRLGLLLAFTGWISFDRIYVVMSWACWVPNLIIMEYYIRIKRGFTPAAA